MSTKGRALSQGRAWRGQERMSVRQAKRMREECSRQREKHMQRPGGKRELDSMKDQKEGRDGRWVGDMQGVGRLLEARKARTISGRALDLMLQLGAVRLL